MSKLTAQYYNTRSVYEKVSRQRVQAIRQLLPDSTPLTILDVGCGAATLGVLLKKEGHTVIGMDVSTQAVEQARTRLDDAYVFDVAESVLPSEITTTDIDAVVISEVLEHLFEPEQLLLLLKEKLPAGTPIVITVPNILFWRNRINILLGHFEYTDEGLMDRGHIHFFSWHSLQELVTTTGFSLLRTAHVVPTRITKPFEKLLPGLFAYQFAICIAYEKE